MFGLNYFGFWLNETGQVMMKQVGYHIGRVCNSKIVIHCMHLVRLYLVFGGSLTSVSRTLRVEEEQTAIEWVWAT